MSVPVPPNKAIVGANAFAHEAGIHQDGVLKNPLTYEILKPESVGAPGTRIVLGKHSGTRGVDARCRALGYRLRPEALARVYARLVTLADTVKTIEDHHVDAGAICSHGAPDDARSCRSQVRAAPDRRRTAAARSRASEDCRPAGRRHRAGGHAPGRARPADGRGRRRHDVRFDEVSASAPWRFARAARALPDATLQACLASDAVLLGAVGDPAFDKAPPAERPEAGLLKLRRALGGFANLRPARCEAALVSARRRIVRRTCAAPTS